jgi:hypothetical protein
LETPTAKIIDAWIKNHMALADLIIGNESGGDPNARNPNSSAGGLGQFIDSTWVSMLQKHRPDLVEGKTPQELIALKSDPALSRQMTEAYANDNGAILTKSGLPVTPGNTYLAHFAGPQGAVSVLNASPNAPVEGILGAAAVKANPFLQGWTAGDLQAWADRKMGGKPQAAAQAAPATTVMPLQAPPSAPPIFPQDAPKAVNSGSPTYFGQIPAEQIAQPPPIFAPPRKPIDLSRLAAALQASGNRGFFNARG